MSGGLFRHRMLSTSALTSLDTDIESNVTSYLADLRGSKITRLNLHLDNLVEGEHARVMWGVPRTVTHLGINGARCVYSESRLIILALTASPALESLTLRGCGRFEFGAVSLSHLRCLALVCDVYSPSSWDLCPMSGPILSLLGNLENRLEVLDLSACSLNFGLLERALTSPRCNLKVLVLPTCVRANAQLRELLCRHDCRVTMSMILRHNRFLQRLLAPQYGWQAVLALASAQGRVGRNSRFHTFPSELVRLIKGMLLGYFVGLFDIFVPFHLARDSPRQRAGSGQGHPVHTLVL